MVWWILCAIPPEMDKVEYRGPFVFLGVGLGVGAAVGLEIGPAVGAGVIGFASPTAPSIRGYSLYFSGSLAIDPAPVVDIAGGLTFYTPVGKVKSYRQHGPFGGRTYVIGEQISQDIRNGAGSPWLAKVPNLQGGGSNYLKYSLIREPYLQKLVSKYVDIFNQIHYYSFD
jgi:hypothetical protein